MRIQSIPIENSILVRGLPHNAELQIYKARLNGNAYSSSSLTPDRTEFSLLNLVHFAAGKNFRIRQFANISRQATPGMQIEQGHSIINRENLNTSP